MPTLKEVGDQLHQIAEWVHGLESQLVALGSHLGSGTPTTSGKKRGRPFGSRNKTAKTAPVPRKRGRRGSLGKEIVSYLQKAKGPVMPLQIRKDLNALATSVSTTLNRLAKAGHVKRDKGGRGWTA